MQNRKTSIFETLVFRNRLHLIYEEKKMEYALVISIMKNHLIFSSISNDFDIYPWKTSIKLNQICRR